MIYVSISLEGRERYELSGIMIRAATKLRRRYMYVQFQEFLSYSDSIHSRPVREQFSDVNGLNYL
jgi:hypothetical protein